MKMLLQILLIALLAFGATVSLAQNGAVIYKGSYEVFGGAEYNPDEGLLYFYSNFSDVCGWWNGDDDWGIVNDVPWLLVQRPNDDPLDGKYQDRAFFFMRVLMATPDEFWSDPCGVWSNPDLIFADGMIHSVYNDNDLDPVNTKRQNVWGFTSNGALEDFGDYCKGEMVGLKWKFRAQLDDVFPDCLPDCNLKVLNQVGPELKCN